jgi:hypothetical protein
MSDAHEQLKTEVADRLEHNTLLIAKKREEAGELRREIAELREAIETDKRLDRALNPKPRNTAKDLYGNGEEGDSDQPPVPDDPAPAASSFRLQ